MKKNKILFGLATSILAISLVTGCGPDVPPDEPTPELPQSQTVRIKINDLTVMYDGEEHSIYVENLPEGATVEYKGNNRVNPGSYTVTAVVTFSDGSKVTKTANLFIRKNESVLSADLNQTATTYGGAIPTYTLNNSSQTVVCKPIYRPGEYKVEIYAEANEFYKESNHVIVNLKVVDGNPLDVSFKSEKYVYDGTPKKLEATNIPAGYRAVYKNNEGTAKGKYNASCEIYDANDNLALTLNAILEIDSAKNQEFETYLDEFFVDYLGNDYISWNIFTVNPENFGLIRDVTDEATWYSYSKVTAEDMSEAFDEMKQYKSLLEAFDAAELSEEQLISYNRLTTFFDSYIEYYDPANSFSPLMLVQYIDQFGGMAADFGTYAEAYEFRTEQDIKDLLSYIKSMPYAFGTYVTYGQDRIEAGYPLSDYTIGEMTTYLNEVIAKGDDYYLSTVIKNKIEQCDYLSTSVKNDYYTMVDTYMSTYFMPAHEQLKAGIQTLKGNCLEEGYLASYGEAGKKLYEYELKDLLGIPDLTLESYGEYLYDRTTTYANKANSILSKAQSNSGIWNSFMKFYRGYTSIVGITDPNEMVDYLKEFATTIVPTLETTPNIYIKEMDKAAGEASNAVAYYMKSPLDSELSEHITLNGTKLGDDYNETLSTMAHEGYPGHLYAYIYNKQLDIANITKIMTSTAHAEGWATYVQIKLYEYIKTHHPYTSSTDKDGINYYCDYMIYSNLSGYLGQTYADYGIHILGWKAAEINEFFGSIGFSDTIGDSLFKQLIEMPTDYTAYGYGMSYFVDLHDNAKQKLGDLYDEIEFNAAILSHGWCSLGELKQVCDEYIADTNFVLGALRK